MAPMLKPRLGDMYQEEEAEGKFNLTRTTIFACSGENQMGIPPFLNNVFSSVFYCEFLSVSHCEWGSLITWEVL